MITIKYLLCVILIAGISLNGYAQRRWSPKAKNAVIGAGAGAIIGALVSKNNRASGALIGGAIGGGAGYLYGRHRVHERQEEALAARRSYRSYGASRTSEAYRQVSEPNTLMTSQANAAYSNAQNMEAYNYFQNAAYGYQRRSW